MTGQGSGETASTSGVRLPLNVALLRTDITNPIHSLSSTATAAAHIYLLADQGLEEITDHSDLEATVENDVIVAFRDHTAQVPPWQSFLRVAFNVSGLTAGAGRSAGAVVFTAVNSPSSGDLRWLAWCFGTGSRMLNRLSTHPRFGLLVALNCLTESEDETSGAANTGPSSGHLRQIAYRTVAPYTQQTTHRAARDIPVSGFRFDRRSDLVAAAGGRTHFETFPDVLGGRTFRFATHVSGPSDFLDLAGQLLTLFESDSYRQRYDWADFINLVEDPSVISELNRILIHALLSDPPAPSIDVLLPDDLLSVDDERAIEYILFPQETQRHASRRNLTVREVNRYVGSRSPSGVPEAMDILKTKLRFIDVGHERLADSSFLECLSADLTWQDHYYILYDGDYYSVEARFLDDLNQRLATVPHASLPLPCHNGGSEPAYNQSVGTDHPEKFLVLDRQLIRLSGETPFEACDLLSAEADFVHVKVKGQSASFSHLCFQATNSAELLAGIPEARQKLGDLVDAYGGSDVAKSGIRQWLTQSQRVASMSVVIAILGDWHGRDIRNLPLFSRISLLGAVSAIQRLGSQLAVQLVDVCSNRT